MTKTPRIHAGTVIRYGQTTHYYTDVIDVLPPDIREYRQFSGEDATLANPLLREAIKEVEESGERVCWQVGDEYYETDDVLSIGSSSDVLGRIREVRS